jgi:RNA methyltransferase, TrmH family
MKRDTSDAPRPVREISSRQNPAMQRIAELVRSAQFRRAEGATVIDGPHLIDAYLGSGRVPQLVVLASRAGSEARALFERCSAAERLLVPDRVFDGIAAVDSPVGILAVVAIPASPGDMAVRGDWVVLDRLQDPGNVGTVIRTAAAAGIGTIATTAGTADVWSPRVLRAAMGAHFGLNLVEGFAPSGVRDDRATRAGHGPSGHQTVATTLDAAVSVFDANLRPPTMWLFGREGNGLAPELAAVTDLRVRIPMAAHVESLNVAAAAAICLFEQVRQRQETRAWGQARP